MFVCLFFFSLLSSILIEFNVFRFCHRLVTFQNGYEYNVSIDIGIISNEQKKNTQNKTKPPHDLVCARLSSRLAFFFSLQIQYDQQKRADAFCKYLPLTILL